MRLSRSFSSREENEDGYRKVDRGTTQCRYLSRVCVGLRVVLADCPGKLKVERRIVAQSKVVESLNWLRRKLGQPPFHAPSISQTN
jgi:hypothetical protein